MQKSFLGIDNLLNELNANQINPSLLDINLLMPDPNQPRKLFNDQSIEELSESIKKHGLLQPILVQKRDNKYIILAGERRYRASKKAGLTSVPVQITNFSDENKLEVSLIENIQREDLNPLDIAYALSALTKKFNITQEELAQKISKSRSYVANVLRLLTLPETIQKEIRGGKISLGHAKILAGCSNPEEVVDDILTNKLSVRETEKKVREKRSSPSLNKSEDTLYIQQKIEDKLQVRTDLEIDNSGRGKATLHFDSLDHLDQFLLNLEKI